MENLRWVSRLVEVKLQFLFIGNVSTVNSPVKRPFNIQADE